MLSSRVGKNVSVEVERDTLIIRIDLSQNYGPSSSGKTEIIATTSGAKKISKSEDMADMRLNLTLYRV